MSNQVLKPCVRCGTENWFLDGEDSCYLCATRPKPTVSPLEASQHTGPDGTITVTASGAQRVVTTYGDAQVAARATTHDLVEQRVDRPAGSKSGTVTWTGIFRPRQETTEPDRRLEADLEEAKRSIELMDVMIRRERGDRAFERARLTQQRDDARNRVKRLRREKGLLWQRVNALASRLEDEHRAATTTEVKLADCSTFVVSGISEDCTIESIMDGLVRFSVPDRSSPPDDAALCLDEAPSINMNGSVTIGLPVEPDDGTVFKFEIGNWTGMVYLEDGDRAATTIQADEAIRAGVLLDTVEDDAARSLDEEGHRRARDQLTAERDHYRSLYMESAHHPDRVRARQLGLAILLILTYGVAVALGALL